MTTKSKPSKLPKPETEEAQANNGCERLLALLDSVVVDAPRDRNAWKKMERNSVVYLTRTVAGSPWLNHLALACVICSEDGLAGVDRTIASVHRFLRWALPDRYPDVNSLKPLEALVAYFGDPPQPRGGQAYGGYSSLQFHVRRYLESVSAIQREKLEPFLLPTLDYTLPLRKLRARVSDRAQARRKEQAFAVVRDLHALIAMGRQRYKWLADLDAQVQQVAALVKAGQALPVVIRCQDLDHQREIAFRVWDRPSWLRSHRTAYSSNTLNYTLHEADANPLLFLQLIGDLPENPWFLRAVELGVLRDQGHQLSPAQKAYLRESGMPDCFFTPVETGLVSPSPSKVRFLGCARQRVAGTPEDSRVLFYVEPFLAAAAIGLFTLVCLTQSGMRIGELQQVSGGKDCMKIGFFPQFDDTTGGLTPNPTRLYFWQLYPKGRPERQPYPVTPYMQEALKVWGEIHKRFCGSFKEIPPNRKQFTRDRFFPGKHLFVLQWRGKHLPAQRIEMCLDFLLLEHLCLDSSGKRTRITAHVLRHGIAGYLRNQGVPLEDIAGLLKQVNVMVTDYYSKLSPQDLHAKLSPFLTRLCEVAEIQLSTIRTPDDIQTLSEEALKRYGVLRHIPGGHCADFTSCEVEFKCAACLSYIPDPARRNEVREKIASCQRTVQFLEISGDYLQADVQRAHCRRWERVEREMEALAAVELTSPPFESVLADFGIDRLDEVDEEWLLTLKRQQPQLPVGGQQSHA